MYKCQTWYWASLIGQVVKNPPAMQETLVQFLGREDPLEKGKTTHSSILAWRIPWCCKELDTTERLSHSDRILSILYAFIHIIITTIIGSIPIL